MALPSILLSIEETGLSVWLRESLSLLAFPLFLTAHTIGLAMLAGPSVAIDLRLLGVAPQVPLAPLDRFFRMIWTGFWVNAGSGVMLLIAYPTKALTDPVFYIKLGFIALAVISTRQLQNRVFRPDSLPLEDATAQGARRLAALSLAFWAGAIISGRLIAYTYKYLVFPS